MSTHVDPTRLAARQHSRHDMHRQGHMTVFPNMYGHTTNRLSSSGLSIQILAS